MLVKTPMTLNVEIVIDDVAPKFCAIECEHMMPRSGHEASCSLRSAEDCKNTELQYDPKTEKFVRTFNCHRATRGKE
jgi:hypothetical protein